MVNLNEFDDKQFNQVFQLRQGKREFVKNEYSRARLNMIRTAATDAKHRWNITSVAVTNYRSIRQL